jgi:hypothetical protein
MEIFGLTHPIPEKFANRIYEDKKTVFVGKSFLNKVKIGDKFVIYESHGKKAYTGWANIKLITQMQPSEIIKKYGDKLIINEKEFREYSKNRNKLTIIEFESFQKFKNIVIPKRWVSLSGKYIYKDEFEFILNNKDK